MIFRLTFTGKEIGFLDMDAERFDVTQITDKARRKALEELIGGYFRDGIRDGSEPLFPDDPRFILELAVRLHEGGYGIR